MKMYVKYGAVGINDEFRLGDNFVCHVWCVLL